MKRITYLVISLFLYGTVSTQCTDPGNGPYGNFNGTFGGAPDCIESGQTVAVNTLTGIDIWPSDSYAMNNIEAGVQYEFGVVNGAANAGSAWPIHFTVLDGGGTPVTSGPAGPGTLSSHAISWTAPSAGSYLIVIREVGECSPPYSSDFEDNGTPYIANLSTQESCVPCDDSSCEAGSIVDDTPVTLCPDEFTSIDVNGVVVPGPECEGELQLVFSPGPGGTGAVPQGFYLIDPSFPYSFDSDVNGILSFNSLEPLRGTWKVQPAVASQGMVCDTTFSHLEVTFLDYGEGPCDTSATCVAGDVLLGDQTVCPTDPIDLSLTKEHVLPSPGIFYWYFENVSDTSDYRLLNFGNDPGFYQYQGDLNFLLAQNNIDTLTPGDWYFLGLPVDLTDTTFCDETPVYIFSVLDSSDPLCGGSTCSLSETAPVDITKSQQPVPYPNGVIDRAQVKWYKASPQVKYTAEDNTAVDIEFWPIRDLATNTPIIDGDTTLLSKKTKPNKDFFKWPIKYDRSDVHPNTRYRFRIRVYCDAGNGPVSPWSEEKIFNTPDFDPETGIFTPPGIDWPEEADLKSSHVVEEIKRPRNFGTAKAKSNSRVRMQRIESVKTKHMSREQAIEVVLFPNPVEGILNLQADRAMETVIVRDMAGRILLQSRPNRRTLRIELHSLSPGMYIIEVESQGQLDHRSFVVK
ncbi:MAG: T9SS type A sorting domain-containing protein [Flavobacteriales bacterium]|nr:T9SS type A sorting domain-containing protein [Flavobacteriales bacterium]